MKRPTRIRRERFAAFGVTRIVRELRLIPIALIASAALLVLTIADLALGGGSWFADDHTAPHDSNAVVHTSADALQPPDEKLSWAQQMFNFPTGRGAAPTTDIAPFRNDRVIAQATSPDTSNDDITGSIKSAGDGRVDTKAPVGKVRPAGPNAPTGNNFSGIPPVQGVALPADGAALPSGAERAILERLEQRREQLDTRARELDIRENLVKAAEQRISAQLAQLKVVEGRISAETKEKDQVEATRFKGLVTMYENMKPRDAAKIFDGLDMDILIKVVSQINPRAMSDIMAQMSPLVAQRLTADLANRAQQTAKNDPNELPKIEGHPTTP